MTVIKNTLQEFYRVNEDQKPTGVEDLKKYAENAELHIFDKVETGDIAVVWNLSEATLKAAQPPVIVAFPTHASTKGGLVVLSNFTVKRLTANEFANTAHAKAE